MVNRAAIWFSTARHTSGEAKRQASGFAGAALARLRVDWRWCDDARGRRAVTGKDKGAGASSPLPPIAREASSRGADTDQFGLPVNWNLLTDTPRREAAVRDLVWEVFATAVRHLGDAEARELFQKVSTRTRGRPGGAQDPVSDRELLAIYDTRAAGLTPRQRRLLARQIAAGLTRFASEEAAAKHIRRLVNQRKAERDAADEHVAEMRRRGITSILGDL